MQSKLDLLGILLKKKALYYLPQGDVKMIEHYHFFIYKKNSHKKIIIFWLAILYHMPIVRLAPHGA